MTPTFYFMIAATVGIYLLYSRRRRGRILLEVASYWAT